jgi:predicted PolB exonuclease-like 3'-5' exonuclease
MPGILDRPVAAFDIETIPDAEIGRRVLGLTGSDADVVHEMVRQRLEETNGKSEYPQLPWHQIVSVCATLLDPATGRVQIRAFGQEEVLDERSHVEGFFRFFAEGAGAPLLVSWNGSGFDIPVLRYRAMMLGLQAPQLNREDDDRRSFKYHVDLMDLLSGYGATSRVGLGTMCGLVGLPGKTFLERPIYDHVLDGEKRRVTEYCKMDTVQTMLVFLLWAFHCGRLTREDLRRHVDGVRRALGELTYPAWREFEPVLDAWPSWAATIPQST